MFTIKRILIPVDYSEVSRAAISMGLQLANLNPGCELHVLHVHADLDTELARRIEEAPDEDFIESTIANHERALQEAVDLEYTRAAEAGRPMTHLPITIRVSGGDWLQVCRQMIDDLEVDLVVAGTHGGGSGIKALMLGSETERLVRKAPCSVFVVKPAGYPYLRD
jgi:nucleotide-binding universal stress UspA family protein